MPLPPGLAARRSTSRDPCAWRDPVGWGPRVSSQLVRAQNLKARASNHGLPQPQHAPFNSNMVRPIPEILRSPVLSGASGNYNYLSSPKSKHQRILDFPHTKTATSVERSECAARFVPCTELSLRRGVPPSRGIRCATRASSRARLHAARAAWPPTLRGAPSRVVAAMPSASWLRTRPTRAVKIRTTKNPGSTSPVPSLSLKGDSPLR